MRHLKKDSHLISRRCRHHTPGRPSHCQPGTIVLRRLGFSLKLSVCSRKKPYSPCLVHLVTSPPHLRILSMIGFRNLSIVKIRLPCSSKLSVFLRLFHLQQPNEGVSERPFSVSHIPAMSRWTWHHHVVRRQQEADHVPHRAVESGRSGATRRA